MGSRVGDSKFNSPKRLAEIAESKKIRHERMSKKRYKQISTPEAMEKRILNVARNKIFDIKVLTPQQHRAIDLMADFINCWSWDYICGQCGINLSTLHRWRNDAYFLRELDKELTRRRAIFRMEALRMLFRRMRRKDRLLLSYLKMTGDLTDKLEIDDKSNKNADELDSTTLDQEIKRLSDELGISESGTES